MKENGFFGHSGAVTRPRSEQEGKKSLLGKGREEERKT